MPSWHHGQITGSLMKKEKRGGGEGWEEGVKLGMGKVSKKSVP